jgi:hypothetical protein
MLSAFSWQGGDVFKLLAAVFTKVLQGLNKSGAVLPSNNVKDNVYKSFTTCTHPYQDAYLTFMSAGTCTRTVRASYLVRLRIL